MSTREEIAVWTNLTEARVRVSPGAERGERSAAAFGFGSARRAALGPSARAGGPGFALAAERSALTVPLLPTGSYGNHWPGTGCDLRGL